MNVRVAVADDSALLRRGLSALLTAEGLAVVGEAADADELLKCVRKERPDVAVVDIRMPPSYTTEGIDAARTIRRSQPETGILLLSQYVETESAMNLLEGGANDLGYLLKERVSDIDDFVDALCRVASGGTAVDPDVVERLTGRPRVRSTDSEDLTGRDLDVLELMAEGRTNQAIGRSLFLGERTVETHIHRIFRKLGLRPEPEDHRRVLAVLRYLRSTQGSVP
ncbi:response regulator transcription factor [Arthrobacter celericrescens]|uniref:response regulator transcription factor n=1 Tax=Arthrobacter celericrescens TaxID=2320851 RepID=UPI000EA0C240|nr:response regulator transcription factor [Arthrobacter celericrescens]